MKKVLLIGPSSPMGVCFPNEYCRHHYIFHVGNILYENDVENEFIPALTEADVLYSFLTEEEAAILSRAIKLEVPSRNITRLEEAFYGGYSFSYFGKPFRRISDPKIYFVLPWTEESVMIHRVWLSFTGGGG
jgi:hypothetical protein